MFDFFYVMTHWISQVFFIVLGTLLFDLIQKKVLSRIESRLQKTKHQWDHNLISALRAPLSLLIWIVGLTFAVQLVGKQAQTTLFSAVDPLRKVGVILTVAWFLIRLIKRFEASVLAKQLKKGGRLDKTTADALGKVLRASIVITTGLVLLQTLGFSISGVLAFGGIGGIAIGFASKDLLANFFGAFMIYWDRPFVVGDWIRSPDKEIEGTVEAIGWRLTRIRTFSKRPLYVPNAVFSSIAVENPSRMTHRRIHETIGVRYDDAAVLEPILQDVRKMLQEHPEIDQSQTLMVNLNTYGPSSLDFFIYTFTRTTVWTKFHAVKEDVLLKIYNIIASHGAEVAFPTRTLHVPEGVALPSPEKVSLASLKVPPTPKEG